MADNTNEPMLAAVSAAADMADTMPPDGGPAVYAWHRAFIAELGEQGFALVPVSPVSGTIAVIDPLGEHSVTHSFGSHAQFEYAASRVRVAVQRDRVIANQGALS